MSRDNRYMPSLRGTLLGGAAVVGLLAAGAPALAVQDSAGSDDVVVVTGTRIQSPNVVSSSPVTSVSEVELEFQQEANIERIFRNLPATIPGDGQNVNNGTVGAASIDLRGLGTNRSLILVDGKRLTPYSLTGIIDTQTIPVNMLERVDVVTGGASAVYGSDAMSGAVNFILKDDFEGVELSYEGRASEQSDGEQHHIGVLLGTNLNDGSGNVTASLGYTQRMGVQFGDRPFGLVGVSTTNGSGLGGAPVLPGEPECQNPNSVDETASGSTTAIPTALDLPGQTLQFRNDGTLGPRCTVFNFNPFNYYQTPQERFNIDVNGRYEINRHFEFYGRANFTATNVEQQIAPSGVFGNVFEVPLMNPFLSASARQAIIDQVNAFATGAGVSVFDPTTGAIDNNGNGVFDLADSIDVPIRRRTLELGTRSEAFDANQMHIVAGLRGDLWGDWGYDLSYQHGESDRTRVRAGYTNVTNIAHALNTVDATTCITPNGDTGPSTCVPLDLFSGGFGIITDAMAGYASVTALLHEKTTQDILSASASGPISGWQTPWADNPIDAAFGIEYRQETASSLPDSCLQEPPTSCQGGAGGNVLPVSGQFDVYEAFGEMFVPLVEGRPMFEDLNLELGYRLSDYSITGQSETWKAGVNWSPVDSLRFRAMIQQANRAPNISELFQPVTTGLSNATYDPCSAGNPNPIDAELRALCEATGVPPALVGVVGDIVSGQVNQFAGHAAEQPARSGNGRDADPGRGLVAEPQPATGHRSADLDRLLRHPDRRLHRSVLRPGSHGCLLCAGRSDRLCRHRADQRLAGNIRRRAAGLHHQPVVRSRRRHRDQRQQRLRPRVLGQPRVQRQRQLLPDQRVAVGTLLGRGGLQRLLRHHLRPGPAAALHPADDLAYGRCGAVLHVAPPVRHGRADRGSGQRVPRLPVDRRIQLLRPDRCLHAERPCPLHRDRGQHFRRGPAHHRQLDGNDVVQLRQYLPQPL